MEPVGPISPSQIAIHQNSQSTNNIAPQEIIIDDQIDNEENRQPAPRFAQNVDHPINTGPSKKQCIFLGIAICFSIITMNITTFLACWTINLFFFTYWRMYNVLRFIEQFFNFLLYIWGYSIWVESSGWNSILLTIFLLMYLRQFLDYCTIVIVWGCALCCCVGIFGIIFGFVRPMTEQQQKKKRDEYIKKIQETQANLSQAELNSVDFQCSICLLCESDPYKCHQTECNHSFHFDCLKMWLNQHNTCPICRKALY